MTRVAVGRWMRSRTASSLGVSGPWRSIVASAVACEGLSSSPACWRRRRAVRAMTRRSLTARSAWEVVCIAN